MDDLKVYTILNSRFRAFDLSGTLPFSIVFGLCRRSPDDTDHRPIILNAAHSILDVPYALSHGLLQLRAQHPEWKPYVQVDVGQLSQATSMQAPTLSLPSPVGRIGNWRKCLTVYRYGIDAESELAALFEPGKMYSIERTMKRGGGLGFKEYACADLTSADKPNLVNSRSDGRAIFKVVLSLPWPPKLQTRMQRHDNGGAVLGITSVNTGSEAITAQVYGVEHCLIPQGPIEVEEGFQWTDHRPRLIAPRISAPKGSISVIDMKTNTTVRLSDKPTGISPLYSGKRDPRPRLDHLVTLKPGEPLVRRVDASRLLTGLDDGVYGLKMEPRGMWWCVGDVEDFARKGNGYVPRELFQTMISPLMLECQDVVEVRAENGIVI